MISIPTRIVVLAMALSYSALPAIADIESCLNIDGSLDRLACYDEAAGYPPEVTEDITAKSGDTGDWSVRRVTSKIDDSTNVFLSLDSFDHTNCRYDSFSHDINIACRENETNLWIRFGGCFMSSNQGKGRVTYRLDSEDAARRNFLESNNNQALGLWSGGQAIPFIKQMLGHDRMLIRATPFSESTVNGEYNIAGLEEAIKPLREACNW